jgi:hypothetical protein
VILVAVEVVSVPSTGVDKFALFVAVAAIPAPSTRVGKVALFVAVAVVDNPLVTAEGRMLGLLTVTKPPDLLPGAGKFVIFVAVDVLSVPFTGV